MATVYLEDRDVQSLPPFCMKCGEPATVYKQKLFSWQPPWVQSLAGFCFLPAFLLSLVLTKKMRVRIPFCERHRKHYLIRRIVLWTGLAVLIPALLISGTLVSQGRIGRVGQPATDEQVAVSVFFITALVLMLAWLGALATLHGTAIRPKMITEFFIVLTSVGDAFIDRLEDEDKRRLMRHHELMGEKSSIVQQINRAEHHIQEPGDQIK